VQARENSAPLDRRGKSEEGDAYVLRASSCGDRGTRAARWAGLGMGICISRAGIWRESPRVRKSGRRGVRGLAMMACSRSSLDARSGSRNLGEGESCGVLSESERALADFWGVRTGCASSPSSLDSFL
jgi:hypothetical protein